MCKYHFAIVVLLSQLLVACWQDNSPVPLKFNAYEHNPILSPGDRGTWDDYYIALPNVIYEKGVFNMFYMGANNNGVVSIGLATSPDGYNFVKCERNPLLKADSEGYDAFGVGAPVVIQTDSVWIMYFNCLERVDWGPGPYIGMAISKELQGPWIKGKEPVLTTGKRGAWDSGFVFPSSIIRCDDGSLMLYYTGGTDFATNENIFIGLAFSSDGRKWKKYNDPATAEPQYAESDPVLITGKKGDWDEEYVWTPCVFRVSGGYGMIFGGLKMENDIRFLSAGYATSPDGIEWKKYEENPVFTINPDYTEADLIVEVTFEGPSIVFLDSVCLLYYDYGIEGKYTTRGGVARVEIK
jgi:predicted GH43/DUF377 family glycosyl hydrolase